MPGLIRTQSFITVDGLAPRHVVIPTGLVVTSSLGLPVIVGAASAPEPVVGVSTIIYQDTFNRAQGTISQGWVTNNSPFLSVSDGSGHQCIRAAYAPGEDDFVLEKVFTETIEYFVRYYFRITLGWLPYSGITGSGMKWFMSWRPTQLRYTHGTGGTNDGGPVGFENIGYEWGTHDNESNDEPNGFQQNINKTIRFNTVNDGNWHKFTLNVRSGVTGGHEKIWIDDVRILDNSIGQPGVPGGGYHHGSEGISMIQFPGLIVDGVPNSSWSGNIDIKDFVMWHN